jgi:hypothetical protein
MEAALVGLAFLLILVLGGIPLARLADPDAPPVAFGSTIALAVAIVVTGNLAALFGYQLWMPLVVWSFILVGGWAGARRGSARTLLHLPSNRLTLLLLVTAFALAAPLLILPVPMDTDAQGFGYLALMMKKGGTIDTLAPWRPDVAYLYSPGALLIFAALSSLFTSVPMSSVMMGASHAAAFLLICLAWDFGAELYRQNPGSSPTPRTWQWAMVIGAAGSVGLWTALMDAHYPAVFGLLLMLAFVTALARLVRTGRRSDAAAAAVLLAAVAMTHPDSTVISGLGFGVFLVLLWTVNRISWRLRLLITVGVPLGAIVLALPWLVRIFPLLGSAIRSPFEVSLSHWRPLLLYHGLVWPLLALVGAVVWPGRRTIWTWTMVGWLAAIVEFSLLGWLDTAFPAVFDPFVRFHYQFSLAWHGPVIPYMVLGAGSLVWLSRKVDLRCLARLTDGALLALAAVIVLALTLSFSLPPWTRIRLPFEGCFATANDLVAMRWLRENTSPATRVLNYPGDYVNRRDWEAHWVPVIAERDCVYFRTQPFFAGAGLAKVCAEEEKMLAFWRDPANPANAERLRAANLEFVIVPESVGDLASRERSWRWKPPAELSGIVSRPESANYLEKVFEAGGAQVYRVLSPGEEDKRPE